jgi:uncharacterized protein YecT (DUF1311 family)
MEMNVCASKEAARVERELNAVYQGLLSRAVSEPGAVRKIKGAEKAGIAYRDAYMDAMYPATDKQAEYRSMFPMEWDLFRAEPTQQHVAALRSILQHYNGPE